MKEQDGIMSLKPFSNVYNDMKGSVFHRTLV